VQLFQAHTITCRPLGAHPIAATNPGVTSCRGDTDIDKLPVKFTPFLWIYSLNMYPVLIFMHDATYSCCARTFVSTLVTFLIILDFKIVMKCKHCIK
jgi:hypothetical protein